MSRAGIVELALGFDALLAFLIWALLSLRREQPRAAPRESEKNHP